ncbi:phage tail tape measure protein [Streptomyces sp. NPDC005970]|uniref:phage tail tape measure protein n=1 Tax=Streptomyces sp. NPDC005970 TaxID=3156723 RepID=UPI00340309FA
MPSVGYATLQVIPSVRGIGDELRRQLIGPAGGAGGDAGQAAGSSLRDKLKAGAAAAGVAAGALLVAGIVKAIDQANVTSKLQAQLGATSKDAARYGKIAGELYAKGITEDVGQGAEAIRAIVSTGLVPPDATNKQLKSIAAQMSDVSTTFGTDMTLQTQAISALLKNNLAPSASAALDVITRGYQTLGPAADDLLETFQEYPVQLRKLGLDAQTSLGLFRQGLQGGARDTDIIADALKEFSIRSIDMSDSSRAAYKSLGLDAKSMEQQIGKGGADARAGLQTVLDKLREIHDPVKREAAAVGLFGTQAEDAGKSLFKLDPSKAVKTFGDVSGAAKDLGKTLHSGPSHEIEVFTRSLQQAFVNVIGGQVLPVLATIGRWINSNVLPPLSAMTSVIAATLVPVLSSLWSAGEAVIGWLQDMGAWLIPIGIAVAGLTLAITAQAVATGGVTAIFAAYRGAILAWTAVQRGATLAQLAFNAVMNANPVILVITAILALGAALVVAYQKSETFRDIVQTAWQGIQRAAQTAWTTVLKPVFDAIVGAAKAVGDAAVWLWQTILQPVFAAIGLAARILLAIIVTAVVAPIVLAFQLVATVATWLWQEALQPAFEGIAAVALWLWTTVLEPVFKSFVQGVKGLGRIATWLWQNAISPAFDAIGSLVSQWWSGIKTIFGAVKGFITGPLAGAFTWLWHKVIEPVWNGIKTAISIAWETGIKPVFSAVKKGVGLVKDAFSLAAKGIGTVWSGIKKATKGPVQFVVDVVYNNGIRAVWNKVAGFLGLDKLDPVKFARGGRTSGGVPGKDSIPALMMADEFVVKRSSARKVGFGTLDYINRTGQLPAAPVQRFADGGVVGAVGSAVDYFAHPGRAWDKATGWIKDKVKEIGSSKWAQVLAKIPLKMLSGLKDKVIDSAKALFTRDAKGLQKFALKGTFGASVSRWTPVVLQALKLVGQPASLLPVVLRRLQQESGGNPRAINNWDINAKRGDPSRGLMQTIGSTFNAYAGKLRGRGIYDPLANVYASMRYALATYGSLSRAYNRAGGYANGGRPRRGELAWVGERGPELVRFGGGNTEVYDHKTSLNMAAGMGLLRGFAKGTSKAKAAAAARARTKARGEVPGDLSGFTKSLTGSASDISKAAAALAKDLKAAGGAGRTLATQTGKVSAKLQTLAKQRDSVDSRLEAAKSAAADQKKSAQDFFGLGSQTSVTSLGELISGLRGKQAEAATFQGQIAKLSKRGLSQDLIRQLVEQGPGGALIGMVSGASQGQLGELNKLAKSGAKLSTSFGNTMADAMYDSGKQAGRGFLTGLQAQEKELQKAMDKLGASLVTAIKKRLKIKSPSRVTAAIGAQTAQGVAVGLDSTASTVAAAAARVADAAVPAPAPAAVGGVATAAASSGLAAGTRLRLVVGGREFDAYLEEVADGRVNAGFTRARRLLESRS